MPTIIHDRPGDVAAFVAARTGADFASCPYTAIGAEVNGRIVAGAVFNLFVWPDIAVSAAVDPEGRSAVRPLLRACAGYVFGQLRCSRVSASIAANNAASLRAAEKLGFVIEGLKPRALPNGGTRVLLGLYPENLLRRSLGNGR